MESTMASMFPETVESRPGSVVGSPTSVSCPAVAEVPDPVPALTMTRPATTSTATRHAAVPPMIHGPVRIPPVVRSRAGSGTEDRGADPPDSEG